MSQAKVIKMFEQPKDDPASYRQSQLDALDLKDEAAKKKIDFLIARRCELGREISDEFWEMNARDTIRRKILKGEYVAPPVNEMPSED